MRSPSRLPLPLLAVLFVGYATSYFHRADLPTVGPLWRNEPAHAALRAHWADFASLGMFVYAFGKLLGGLLAERFGGRLVFVCALLGAGLAEALAAMQHEPLPFAACRVAGMLVLGCAWPALGDVAARATPAVRLATAMAFLSQSYLLGDAAVRALLAAVVARGGDSHAVFTTSATALLGSGSVVALALLALRSRTASPLARSTDAAPTSAPLRATLWALAAMNFALALGREGLSLWAPVLLVERGALGPDAAVRASALLPLASGVCALLAGPLADRGGRAWFVVLVAPCACAALALGALVTLDAGSPWLLPLLVAASALLVMPMTLASGVLPLRLGGAGGARRLGFVDGAGSSGAVLAGTALARVQRALGDAGLFATLAGTALLALLLAFAVQRRLLQGAAEPHA